MRPRHPCPISQHAAVVPLFLVLLVTGCSTGEPDDEAPAGAGSRANSATASGATADDGPANGPAGESAPVTTSAGESVTADDDDAEVTAGSTADLAVATAADEAFTLHIPDGWADVTDTVPQDIELALRAEAMSDDFFTNVVVASEEPIDDLSGSLEGAAQEIAGEAGSFQLLPPVEVAGETAHGYVVTRTNEGMVVVQTQRWMEHGDRLYVVTLSSAQSQQDRAEALFDQILNGWAWTDE